LVSIRKVFPDGNQLSVISFLLSGKTRQRITDKSFLLFMTGFQEQVTDLPFVHGKYPVLLKDESKVVKLQIALGRQAPGQNSHDHADHADHAKKRGRLKSQRFKKWPEVLISFLAFRAHNRTYTGR